MTPLRARWPDRRGFILAVVGVSLGLGVVRQSPTFLSGTHLLIWLIALATLAIPVMIMELSLGVIFQSAAAECLRKADRRLEWIGWLGAGLAFLTLVLAGRVVGDLAVSAYDSVLAALGDQPLPWAIRLSRQGQAVHSHGAVILAVAVIMALIDSRLWRGAPSISRTASLMVPCGLVGLALLLAVFSARPGAIDGMARMLAPGPEGWRDLLNARVWLDVCAYVLVTWMFGLGIFAAFGSYLNRSSDVIGVAAVSVFASGIGQVLIALVVFLASGLVGGLAAGVAPSDTTNSDGPLIESVPIAIANLGFAPWLLGLLALVWFISLLAFAMPALLALAEAVVSPLVDKFHMPRERAVAGICLAAFFLAAPLAAQHARPWWAVWDLVQVGGIALVVALQGMVAWWFVKLDALQRHLNAYSAFSVGWGWRWTVAGVVPLVCVAVVIERLITQFVMRPVPVGDGSPAWLATGVVVMALMAATVVVSRLPTRSA